MGWEVNYIGWKSIIWVGNLITWVGRSVSEVGSK
jgi:hypothetical protein